MSVLYDVVQEEGKHLQRKGQTNNFRNPRHDPGRNARYNESRIDIIVNL